MKRGQKNVFQLFFVLLLAQKFNTQYVYTQLGGTKTYSINTRQDNQVINLGSDFQSTRQYSLWGWFKPESQNPAIQNILTLQNLEGDQLQLQRAEINFPNCPYTKEELDSNVNLRNQQFVQENPNCDFGEIKTTDLLIVNFDIQPNENQLSFLVASGYDTKQNNSKVILEIFKNLPKNDNWIYFGISADYENGNIHLFLQSFDKQITQQKDVLIEYPNFNLTNPARLIIARIEQNIFYESQSGFIGKIANIEMSRFFTQDLKNQWAGYLPSNQRQQNSIILDLIYDVNGSDKAHIQNYGKLDNKFKQLGNFQILNKIDQNQYGLRYFENSYLSLSEDYAFDSIDSNTNSISFYFNLRTSKNLPQKFVLLTRGIENNNGYLQILIVTNNKNQKFIRTIVSGPNKTHTFDSSSYLRENSKNQFILGIAQGLDNSLKYLYADSNGGKYEQTLYDVKYDMGFIQLTMFNPNNKIENYNPDEYVDLFRFMILNSTSPIIYKFNKDFPSVQKLIESNNILQELQCQFKTDVYDDQICIKCQNSIVNQEYQCIPYCNLGYKNLKNDICLPCMDNNPQCPELIKTTYNVGPIKLDQSNDQKTINNQFEIEPTNPILNGPIPYEKFQFQLAEDPKQKLDINVQALDNQKAIVTLNNVENHLDQNLVIKPYEDNEKNLIDINRNLLQSNGTSINKNILLLMQSQNMNDQIKKRECYFCDAPSNRLKKMRVLAYILLLSYAGAALILLIMTIIAFNKFWNLGGLWKFLLHNWMKLNLIAFLVLLAINMPCCVNSFLHQIYRFTVSWDHELRHWINKTNDDSTDFNEGFIKRSLPCQFYNEYVRPFILHNLLISFIVQLAIALIYIILKIWDYLQTSGKSFLFQLLVFWEFTALIIGYLLFHMRDFVFSALNIREVIFSHSYFVCCFFISIFYLAVFIAFWVYCLLKLFQDNQYWSNPINVNKFYFFRAGYRDNQLARTYDLWVTLAHFLIGLTIGFFIYEPLVQMIIITVVLVLLFGATILLRPWKNIILLICDFLTQIAILIAVIFFLIFAILDKGSCENCGDREASSCWIIVLIIFIFFMLSLIGLLVAALLDCLKKGVVEQIVEQEDIYHEDKEFIMQHGSSKYIYPMGQDMLDADSKFENQVQSINRNTDSVNVNQYNTNEVFVERFTDKTVNQVKSVQPDEVDEDSMQNELFGLMNDQSLRYRQSQLEMTNNSKILNQQKNEFYSKLDDESQILKNKTYQNNNKLNKF